MVQINTSQPIISSYLPTAEMTRRHSSDDTKLTQPQESVIRKIFITLREIPRYLSEMFTRCCRSIKEGGVLAYLHGLILRCKNVVLGIWPQRTPPQPADINKEATQKTQTPAPAQELPAATGSATATLTPAQKELAGKLQKCTVAILSNIFKFFLNPQFRKMHPVELRELLEAAQEERAAHLDERTAKFMHEIVTILEEELNLDEKLSQAFSLLAKTSGDPHILTKVIEGISYPFIKNLIEELDREYPQFIDSYLHNP